MQNSSKSCDFFFVTYIFSKKVMSSIFDLITERNLHPEDINDENVNSILYPCAEYSDKAYFYGCNPFLFCVMTGNKQYLEMLKDKGCDINFIRLEPSEKITSELEPTDPNYYIQAQEEAKAKRFGDNAVVLAIKGQNADMLQYLHEDFGFSLDYVDNEGNTLTHIAIIAKAARCIDYIILQNPQTKSMKNNDKMTPLELAKYLYYDMAICALEGGDSCRSINSMDSARSSNSVEIVEFPEPEHITRGSYKLTKDPKIAPYKNNPKWDAQMIRRIKKQLPKWINVTDDLGRNLMHHSVMQENADMFITILKQHGQIIFEPDTPIPEDIEADIHPKTALDYLIDKINDDKENNEFISTIVAYLYDQIDHYDENIQKEVKEAMAKNEKFKGLLNPGANVVY